MINKTLSVALCTLVLLLVASPSLAAIKRQTIKNDSGGNANDLHLDWIPDGNKVTDAKLWHTGNSVDTDMDDINDAGERIAGAAGANQDEADWAQNSFGTIANGGTADIDYSAKADSKIDASQSYWTLNGANVGGVKIVGEPMTVVFNAGNANARFANPSATATVTYTNIQLWKNNAAGNYNPNHFDEPTGALVGGTPASIVLGPGQQQDVPFGAIAADGYQLVRADVFDNAVPGDLYNVVTADCEACVPAISEWGLMALALSVAIAATIIVLRRKNTAAWTA